ncbi:MAG TPA: methyltransferase [Polyangiaceae bacterium]|jgi:SAM-dependent methyltransferase
MSPAEEPFAVLRLLLRYDADVSALSPRLRACFIELEADAATDAFLAAAARGRHDWLRTRLHRMLRFFVSDFDANGMLDMYPLHVASPDQWRAVLGGQRAKRLLDVGAGYGGVTRTLLPFAEQAAATELSAPMARSVRRMGVPCHRLDITEEDVPGAPFDLVSCLNVLDRTARPRRMLRRLVELLEPGGRLLIALVLPYRPFYYVGSDTPEPLERLACAAPTWEAAVSQLVEHELEPLGLRLLTLARAPYLSFGDTARSLYQLDDALLVLEKP